MRIVTERRIREFVADHPDAADALWRWADAVEALHCANPGELKRVFGTASFVGEFTVFNVGGNKFRVAAYIHYRRQVAYIKRIGTHKEYDGWDLVRTPLRSM